MPRYLLLFSLLLVTRIGIQAQNSAGTEFWLGYMENLTLAFNDPPAFSVIINADAPTNGSIDVPTTGLSIPFSVPVGSTEVFLPDAVFYTQGSEIIDNKGIRITTEEPVRVQAYHYRLYFSESSNVLPVTELGTDYLVTTMVDEDGVLQPGSLVIVATTDNTTVEIIPSTLTLGLRPAGIPFTITLNAGQNYQVKAAGELTGTSIRSLTGAPIAVFSGSQQADVEDGICTGGADSHIWDQSLPLEDWRELYYFVPFSGQGGDRVRIVAAEDNTTVFFDCENVAQLNEGELFNTFITDATVISSTAPVSVTQYTNGYSCEPSQLGDPNGLSYLPADFLGTSFRWRASDRINPSNASPQFEQHYITVIGHIIAMANLTLDGTQITTFNTFAGNPDWQYVQINVGPGEHELLSLEGVQAYSYGFAFADAYTNNLGYTQVEAQDFSCLDINRTGILCVDSLQQFSLESSLNLVDFNWDFGDMTSSTLAEPTHIYNTAGTYEVTLTAIDPTGTEVSVSTLVTIVECDDDECDDLIIEDVLIEGDLCIDSSAVFTLVYSSDEPVISTIALFPEGTVVDGDVLTIGFDAAEDLNIIFTLQQITTDCATIFNLPVTVEDCPPDCTDAQLTGINLPGEVCPGDNLIITPFFSSEPTSINWQLPDGSSQNTPILDNITSEMVGPYPVRLQAFWDDGCEIDTTFTLDITVCTPPPDCEVMIPNIFSPNNDGVNDRFRIFYNEECLPNDYELFLYNRWGSQVYRSSDPTASWDGRFKGQPHPQEVLVYWCRFRLPDGSVQERKGDVTLIR